jgi:4-aminobutyrate aminotransferase-like enzyme
MSNTVDCWDIRGSEQILYSLERNAKTRQRLYISVTDEVLMGDMDGNVYIHDLNGNLKLNFQVPGVVNAVQRVNETQILACAGTRNSEDSSLHIYQLQDTDNKFE